MTADEDFQTLFAGTRTAYGTEQGGCERIYPDTDPEGTIESVYLDHLDGLYPIGIYPIAGTHVAWGCIDLDLKTPTKPSGDFTTETECHNKAIDLQDALAHWGITGWIERTRSHGRHVWVFVDGWVPAVMMRRALIVACAVSEAPDREVNPKQDRVLHGQLGNYVRLPYYGRGPDSGGGRTIITRSQEDVPYAEFVDAAINDTAPQTAISKLSSYWVPKPRKLPNRPPSNVVWQGGGTHPSPARIIDWASSGVPEDRSEALWWATNSMFESGVGASECVRTVVLMARLWGKWEGREETEATRMVAKVYG